MQFNIPCLHTDPKKVARFNRLIRKYEWTANMVAEEEAILQILREGDAHIMRVVCQIAGTRRSDLPLQRAVLSLITRMLLQGKIVRKYGVPAKGHIISVLFDDDHQP